MSLYLVSLALTLAVESLTALLMGFRGRWFFAGLFLVNLCTHPLLNLLMVLNARRGLIENEFALLAVLEIVVVFAEYHLLRETFRREERNIFLLSLFMNLNSYALGIILFWV